MAFPGGGLRLGAVANSRWLASFLKRTVVCDVEDVLLHDTCVEGDNSESANGRRGVIRL